MRTVALALLASASASAQAAPQLAATLSDHAVLQRGQSIPIWGTAAPREKVTVGLGDTTKATTADKNGAWRVDLPAMQAGGPLTLTATSASGQAVANDILIGDVWLCSGQSNMEYPVRRALNGEGEAQGGSDAQLRLMKVPQQLAEVPQRTFAKVPNWQVATPDSVGNFSAACYFMVRELRASQKVPIGAIDDT